MTVDEIYRDQYGSILATVIRWTGGDFQLAEDALHDAFEAALVQWDGSGPPENPAAWITQIARYKAIDRLRRLAVRKRFAAELAADAIMNAAPVEGGPVPEDALRLIFTCCHPALALEAQVALTLRTLSGLRTEEIARAFLVPVPTMAQRLVRVKHKIRAAKIPYEVPDANELRDRLDAVMKVVYLVFNEGYSASFGSEIVREDLCSEAIRLGRWLVALLPEQTEPQGLLALMLLHDSRRATRVDSEGVLLVLEEQDRTRWNQQQIAEGAVLVERALRGHPPGAYALQAAIAALHARAPTAEATDWAQIAALYGVLARVSPSPIVELNRAVAIAMADGLERGLALLEVLDEGGALASYHLLPAARADLLRRLNRPGPAAEQYRRALELVTNHAERRYLERRLLTVSDVESPAMTAVAAGEASGASRQANRGAEQSARERTGSR